MKRLSTVLLVLVVASRAWGYSEDQLGDDPHSTFHYNLVRTLAAAAGFSAADAEAIADACEATDRGTFSGLVLTGTERPDAHQGQQSLGLYYHFGRRGSQNATGDYELPGEDTCQFFDRAYLASKDLSARCPYVWLAKTAGASGEPGPCQVEDDGRTVSEMAEIELWAVYGRGLPRFGAPTIAKDGGPAGPVAPRSLDALGIYLHALADSYSHEACMEQCSFQGHSVGPASCSAVYWHEIAEYGPASLQNSGIQYTRNAAQAVWLTLKAYRQINGLTGAAKWSDPQAQTFWENDRARHRRRAGEGCG